jgi:hypothetical protein
LYLPVDHALFNVCKSLKLLTLFLEIYLTFDQKYSCQAKYPAGYPALTGYRYPAFGLAGYPAGRISGKNSLWCIPSYKCRAQENIQIGYTGTVKNRLTGTIFQEENGIKYKFHVYGRRQISHNFGS